MVGHVLKFRMQRFSPVLFHVTAAVLLLLSGGCGIVRPGKSARWSSFVGGTEPALTPSQVELKLAFAKAAERRGDYKQALSTYEELAQLELGSADLYHRLALNYDRQGKFELAEQSYLQSLQLNPADEKVICDYGYSLYLRESWDAAETQYRKAIDTDPQYMRARVNLGMLLARTGRRDEAVQQFALGGLSEGATHHNLALAATQDGDSQTAVDAITLSRQVDLGSSASGDHQALAKVVERLAARPSSDRSSNTAQPN
jgi:Flp pilus assembly protein TadD